MKIFVLFVFVVLFIGCSEQISSEYKQEKASISEQNKLILNSGYAVLGPKDYSFTKNGIKHSARVYYPLGNSFESFGLSILLHGNSRDITSHDKLQEKLASNGFVSVSIEWKVNEKVSNILKYHMDYLYKNYKLTSSVGLIGHSQGGAAAYINANVINEYGKTLKSLILVAPGYYYSNAKESKYFENHVSKLQNITPSVLVLYGEKDNDPATWPVFHDRTPTLFYDKISTEYTSYSYDNYPNKSMVTILGGFHGLIDDALFNGTARKASIDYINAHHSWNLKGNSSQAKYFVSQADMGYETSIQYQSSVKKVVANFETYMPLERNLFRGHITYNDIYSKWIHSDQDKETLHHTKSMVINWNKTNTSQKPEVKFYFEGSYRDVTDYEYLSFRVAQRFHTFNEVDKKKSFYVRLKDTNGTYKSVNINDYITLEYPFINTIGNHLDVVKDVKYYIMKTVTIPLRDFEKHGVDLDRIRRLSFRFTHSSYPKGSVIIDNVEFFK